MHSHPAITSPSLSGVHAQTKRGRPQSREYTWNMAAISGSSRVFRVAQMQSADAEAAESGISLYSLMVAAGSAVTHESLSHYPQVSTWHVLVGPGNNGGDGWIAALEMHRAGRATVVWEAREGVPSSAQAARARRAYLREAQSRVLEPGQFAEAVRAADAGIIDALFGTGLSRPLDGDLAQVVSIINAGVIPVVAVDVPSGLNPDLARTDQPHVQAHLTVALAGYKPAHLFEPARSACGLIVLADIGFPAGILRDSSSTILLEPNGIAAAVAPLRRDGNKYDAGTVCIIAGSSRYRGAAELAARAAWRSGAGLVTLVSDFMHTSAWPESIFEQHDLREPWPPAGVTHKRAGALLVGPGLELPMLEHLETMIEWTRGPVVLDATALNPDVIENIQPLFSGRPVVLTPHQGEAGRLLERIGPGDAELAVTDPLQAAALLADKLQATVVLKGPGTVVAGPAGELAVSASGHPAMATGGTGDVLAGVITALLARDPVAEPFAIACAGVVLHGLAGELAAESAGDGLVASDLVGQLPAALRVCRDALAG